MVRLKMAVAGGVLAGGLAIPSAASADTTQVVYAWGYNNDGQAGVDPAIAGHRVLSPVPVHGAAANVTQLSGSPVGKGGGFVLSLRSDGTVWGWGHNGRHQLGDLNQANSFAPVQIHGLPPGIVQVEAGASHGAAVAADGSVWTWGGNDHGALGYPTSGADSPTPHQVPGLSGVKQVAAGENFTVALRSNGEVWTWGVNGAGQLGDGTQTDRTTPARNLTGYGMTQVSAGRYYALALRPGSVWAWGYNGFGQLGNGSTAMFSATPVIVDRRTQNATQIAAGWNHAFAVDPDGSLWAWGSNYYGAPGLSTVGPEPVRTPQKVPGLTGVTQLAAGNEMSVALRSDGTLLVWGSENNGLRGDGIPRDTPLPVPTPVTPLSGVTRIATAGSTVLVQAPVVTMPNVVGALRATALGQLHALGLTVQELTVPDPDRRCDHVGYVESQSPPPGTVVGPGVHVRIRVYGPAQGGCF
jgi:alpha-tubulin suppressor-like RCC1 family protein